MIRFLSRRVNLFIEPIVSQGYWVYHLKMLKKKANKKAAKRVPAEKASSKKASAKKAAKKTATKKTAAKEIYQAEILKPVVPFGRPTLYTQELDLLICQLVMESVTLRRITELPGMPDKSTICRWLAIHKDFRDHYTDAMQIRAEMEADYILDIADDGCNDFVEREDKKGNVKVMVDMENIMRSRLRVDARFKIAENLLPHKYGKKQVEHKHEGGVEVTIRNLVGDVK